MAPDTSFDRLHFSVHVQVEKEKLTLRTYIKYIAHLLCLFNLFL